MIKILSMNPSGIDGVRTIMTFEFTFDNPNELPKNAVYTMNQVIYVIANNSIAISNIDNSVYKFNGKQWIKTGDKITPYSINNITSNGNYILPSSPTSANTNVSVNVSGEEPILIDKTVTENGTYLPADDDATAYSKVVVDVATGPSTGMPKLATPTAAATSIANYEGGINIFNLASSTYLAYKNNTYTENSPNAKKSCNIFTGTPISTLHIPYYNSLSDTLELIFVAGSGFKIQYARYSDDYNYRNVDLPSTVTAGKTYRIRLSLTYATTTLSVSCSGVEEYNDPISFTLV